MTRRDLLPQARELFTLYPATIGTLFLIAWLTLLLVWVTTH